ncbi:MAG: outer membrane lipoprotein carrier protein LolA [Methylobacterium sp.]|uniref:LolA family protein n=1 Tax=unclassified Methylobacterium TaxID=2615210 RepID=UPI0011C9B6B9|nr:MULTISPECIES: outer membrane lipoprotein carrier protein LolA [unclassified Methylobacterium]MDO9429539.1 outer membrane lipoprotein carrier protein LolA [Methylobacterium sp.]TXM75781.1 outer membrane lipoprotein carrier protein LolA [Methylobacterium sp. WL69]
MIGRRHRLAAGPLLVLAAVLIAPEPVAAQGSFLDGLFGRKEEPAPAPVEPAAPPAPVAPKKPAPQAAKPAKDPKDAKAVAGDKIVTPKLPAKAAEPAAKVAAVGAPLGQEADAAGVLAQANAYFNGITTLTGSFIQIGADGRRIGGKLTLAKPGRLRFDYDQPSPLEVVADGTSVAVKDRRLGTQDLYFISQTPLKFLLREKIDLARDLTVSDVSNDPGGVRISMEDRSTLGGTSKIQLFFDAEVKTLSQWRITDPQGYQTTVQLSNLQKGRSVEGTAFFINYGRSEDKAMEKQIRAQ